MNGGGKTSKGLGGEGGMIESDESPAEEKRQKNTKGEGMGNSNI